MDQVTEILSNKKKLLTEVYFDLQRHFEEKYGKDALVFMEIGTFFEVYEVNNDELKIGKAKEIAELLNIQLTRKSKAVQKTQSTTRCWPVYPPFHLTAISHV